MGVTIGSKRYSVDMGYAGFARFRIMVAKQVNEEVCEHYAKLTIEYIPMAKRDEFFKEFDATTLILISSGKLPNEVADFLFQSDCEGKIDRKQAKMIYELIKDCNDDIIYGYTGRDNCATMSDMKKIFSDKTKVEWY